MAVPANWSMVRVYGQLTDDDNDPLLGYTLRAVSTAPRLQDTISNRVMLPEENVITPSVTDGYFYWDQLSDTDTDVTPLPRQTKITLLRGTTEVQSWWVTVNHSLATQTRFDAVTGAVLTSGGVQMDAVKLTSLEVFSSQPPDTGRTIASALAALRAEPDPFTQYATNDDLAAVVLDLPESAAGLYLAPASTPTDLLGKINEFTGTVTQPMPTATPGRVLAFRQRTSGLTLQRAGSDVFVIGDGTSQNTVSPSLPGELIGLHCTTAGQWRVTSSHKPQTALDTRYSLGAGPYLLACFDGDNGARQSLFVYGSPDGTDFKQHVANPVYVPASGRVRDPSIIFRSGVFYVAHTVAGQEAQDNSTIGIVSSVNPLTTAWKALPAVDFSAATAANSGPKQAWAPEFFVDDDGSVYLFVTINQENVYVTRALNATLTSWSTPTRVTLGNTAFNPIDYQIIKIGTTYHMVYKDAQTTTSDHATATSVTGPYTAIHKGTAWTGLPTPTGLGYEGPFVVQVGPQRWRMYVDNVGAQTGMSYIETSDPTLASGWTSLTVCTLDGAPNGFRLRHGSVLRLGSPDAAPAATFSQQARPLDTRNFSRKRHRNAGDTISVAAQNPTWQYVDTALDAVIGPCKVGDIIEVGAEFVWDASTTSEGCVDFVVVTGGAGGTYLRGLSENRANGGIGQAGGYAPSNTAFYTANPHDFMTVTLDDMASDGTVRISMQARVGNGNPARGLFAGASNGLTMWARKLT